MIDIANRIKEVRNKYGATQTQFAALGKVSMRAQQTYESGQRVPDANYLLNLAKFNIDIHYILTGEIQENVLADKEKTLISAYRNADPSKKAAIEAVAKSSPENKDEDQSPPTGTKGSDYSIEKRESRKTKINSEMRSLVFSTIFTIFSIVAIGEVVYLSNIETLHISYPFLSLFIIGYVILNGGISIQKTES